MEFLVGRVGLPFCGFVGGLGLCTLVLSWVVLVVFVWICVNLVVPGVASFGCLVGSLFVARFGCVRGGWSCLLSVTILRLDFLTVVVW